MLKKLEGPWVQHGIFTAVTVTGPRREAISHFHVMLQAPLTVQVPERKPRERVAESAPTHVSLLKNSFFPSLDKKKKVHKIQQLSISHCYGNTQIIKHHSKEETIEH